MVIKTLGAKIFSNLRPYRQHILDPKRGTGHGVYKIMSFCNLRAYCSFFSNLRAYRDTIVEPIRGNKELKGQKFSNLRAYSHTTEAPIRGHTYTIFRPKNIGKINNQYFFFSASFSNLRAYRHTIVVQFSGKP